MTEASKANESMSDSAVPVRKQKVSIVPWVIVFFSCAIIAGWMTMINKNTEPVPSRTAKKYFLPAQYTGKVKITYGIEDADPLKKEEGFYIVYIPLSGVVETSTKMGWGQAVDEFYRKLIKPDEEGNEFERLNFGYVEVHKSGLIGDGNEYFESAKELENRDPDVIAFYEANKDEAQQKMTAGDDDINIPAYEMIIIRDDF